MKRSVHFLTLCAALLFAQVTHGAVSLSDFGYTNRSINGILASGTRPLLVILARYGNDQLTFGTNYYDGIVFTNPGNSIVEFFDENSSGHFRWTRAGLITVQASNFERSTNLTGGAYYSNIVYRAMGQFNFAAHDTRPPFGTVTDDELEMVVLSTDFRGGGGLRGFGSVTRGGLTVSGLLAIEGDQFGLPTIAHELMHGLGFYEDIYGTTCTPNLTVMMWNCGQSEQDSIHADAWHKMQLGWYRPRIYQLSSGGVVQLPAAQLRDTNAPVILYDPGRGTSEFFLLEHRTPTDANGQPWSYDRSLISAGLAIWQVKHNSAKELDFVPPHIVGPNAELGWDECENCNSLYYLPLASISRCPSPVTGTNHAGGRGLFTLVYDSSDPGQDGWRRCRKCQGLFFFTNQGSSDCPVNGTHDGSQSFDYSLSFTSSNFVRAPITNWFRCIKCQGMFAGPRVSQSNCPQDGGTHDSGSTAEYSMWQYDRSVFTVAYPNLARGGNQFWTGGSVSPYLNWTDWNSTQTRIYVRPFAPTDETITVEWWTETDTWVDFNYTGFVANGMEVTPYRTTADGVANAPWGGTVKFKPGTRNEPILVDKRLTFEAPFGTVTIGQ